MQKISVKAERNIGVPQIINMTIALKKGAISQMKP